MKFGTQKSGNLEMGNREIWKYRGGKSRNLEIWRWEIEKSGNMEVGNREIWKSGCGKSRNLEICRWEIEKSGWEIEKSGNLEVGNREIWEMWSINSRNPEYWASWRALLCQIWHNRPQSGALSGVDYPRAGQDRPGPADGPQDPKSQARGLPLGGCIY